MTTKDNLSLGLASITRKAGQQIRVIYFNKTIGSVWDDETALTYSGATWTSGVIFPVNGKQGSTDSILMEQGKLIDSDKKIYINGSLILTGSELQTRIQIGSPTGESYCLIPDGGRVYEVEGQPVYKVAYLRRIGGSLIGET